MPLSANAAEEGAERFEQVTREPSLSDKVVESITNAIVSGQFKPAERLASERELAEQFGVSRTVIREAVRSLVAQGLVETRSGRGVQVAAVDGDAVARSMNLFLRTNPAIGYARVHEVRSALEIQIAGLAAERCGPDDIERLAEINAQLGSLEADDAPSAAKLDLEFHRALATATHNPLFAVMLDAIGGVLLEIRLVAFPDQEVMKYAQRAHGLILERLSEGDAEGARAAMRAHLDDSEAVWRRIGDRREVG